MNGVVLLETGVTAGALGLMVLWLFRMPQRLQWQSPHKTVDDWNREEAVANLSDSARWLVLLPNHWMRWGLRNIQTLVGLFMAGVTFVVTGNPIAAIAFGWIGICIPEALLRDMAATRWATIDREAYATMYSVRFYLQQGLSVIEMWRLLIPKTKGVFRQWIEPCLLSEGVERGQTFESRLKLQAQQIRHGELAVMADIMEAERRNGGTASSMERLMHTWGQRLTLDAERRGALGMYALVSELTLGFNIVMFWAMCLGDATIRSKMHSLTGIIVTGMSAMMAAVAITLYLQQVRASDDM